MLTVHSEGLPMKGESVSKIFRTTNFDMTTDFVWKLFHKQKC